MFLNENESEIVKNILAQISSSIEVYAFGSRVTGKNLKKFSDLDLALVGSDKINFDILAKLKEEFSESDLPFRVDIVDLLAVDEIFAKIIKANCELIKKCPKN